MASLNDEEGSKFSYHILSIFYFFVVVLYNFLIAHRWVLKYRKDESFRLVEKSYWTIFFLQEYCYEAGAEHRAGDGPQSSALFRSLSSITI